ncbi:MAG: hypothetical protein IPG61_10250 [bacterium]|nr:hypothetical protein [bacterium]
MKSRLNRQTYREAVDGINSIAALQRFYKEMIPGLLRTQRQVGRELVFRRVHPSGYLGIGLGDDSIGLMLWWLLELLTMSQRQALYRPNYSKYREALVDSFDGEIDEWFVNLERTPDA